MEMTSSTKSIHQWEHRKNKGSGKNAGGEGKGERGKGKGDGRRAKGGGDVTKSLRQNHGTRVPLVSSGLCGAGISGASHYRYF